MLRFRNNVLRATVGITLALGVCSTASAQFDLKKLNPINNVTKGIEHAVKGTFKAIPQIVKPDINLPTDKIKFNPSFPSNPPKYTNPVLPNPGNGSPGFPSGPIYTNPIGSPSNGFPGTVKKIIDGVGNSYFQPTVPNAVPFTQQLQSQAQNGLKATALKQIPQTTSIGIGVSPSGGIGFGSTPSQNAFGISRPVSSQSVVQQPISVAPTSTTNKPTTSSLAPAPSPVPPAKRRYVNPFRK